MALARRLGRRPPSAVARRTSVAARSLLVAFAGVAIGSCGSPPPGPTDASGQPARPAPPSAAAASNPPTASRVDARGDDRDGRRGAADPRPTAADGDVGGDLVGDRARPPGPSHADRGAVRGPRARPGLGRRLDPGHDRRPGADRQARRAGADHDVIDAAARWPAAPARVLRRRRPSALRRRRDARPGRR